MLACADINESTQELTGARYSTSDQHKDIFVVWEERDDKDEIFQYLNDSTHSCQKKEHYTA